jgi:hypothetical protein
MYQALMADWINFQKYLPVRYKNESRMVSVVEHDNTSYQLTMKYLNLDVSKILRANGIQSQVS